MLSKWQEVIKSYEGKGLTSFLTAFHFLALFFSLAGITEYWEITAAVAIIGIVFQIEGFKNTDTAFNATHNFLAGVKLNQNKNQIKLLYDILFTLIANFADLTSGNFKKSLISVFMMNMGFSSSHVAKNDPIFTKSINYVTGKIAGAFSRKRVKQSRRKSKRRLKH